MEILGTTLRICVDDLEASVAFYEGLTGTPAQRFERGGVSVAAIGCFLLMSGPGVGAGGAAEGERDHRRRRTSTRRTRR